MHTFFPLYLGFGAGFSHAQAGRLYFFPSAACVSLFRLLSCPGRTAIFPHAVIAFAVAFWDCVIHVGVVLATIGPRPTQELFPLFKL